LQRDKSIGSRKWASVLRSPAAVNQRIIAKELIEPYGAKIFDLAGLPADSETSSSPSTGLPIFSPSRRTMADETAQR
jgi:hypothetical protein